MNHQDTRIEIPGANLLVPATAVAFAEGTTSNSTAARALAVVPRYSDIHGKRPTLGDLLAIVRRYNVFEWLSYPVRHGLCSNADKWLYQGEVFALEW